MHHIKQPGVDLSSIWLATVGTAGAGAGAGTGAGAGAASGGGLGYVWYATSSSTGELSWHTLLTDAAGQSDALPIAPLARFITHLPPLTSTNPTYYCSTTSLSIVLTDRSIFAVNLGSLFHYAGSGSEGRGRTSTADSDSFATSSNAGTKRRSLSDDAGGIGKPHGATTTTSTDKKKGTLLGGVLGGGKSLFTFLGASSTVVSSSGVLFLSEEGGAWCPLELTQATHFRHKVRNCVLALSGARGETLLATKGSGVLLVCCSASAVGAPFASHASSTAIVEDISVRDEWNVHAAVTSFLGLDAAASAAAEDEEDANAGGVSEKGVKVYAAALSCGPYLVLGTNRGIVVASYHSARLPSMIACHSSWPFVVASSPMAVQGSDVSCRVNKLSTCAEVDNVSFDGLITSMLSTSCLDEQRIVVTGESDAFAARLIPSVSGKYCCLLLPPKPTFAGGGVSSTFIILATESLQEAERGLCTSFAWVGARENFVLTTAVAVAAAQTNKRSSILNSVKGLLGRDKASKGGELLVRNCVLKAVQNVATSDATGLVSTTGNGGGESEIIAFSGPVVFLSHNAAPKGARQATHGVFYHHSGGAALEPLSLSMQIPVDVQWSPSAGRGSTSSLGACLLPEGSVLILGIGVDDTTRTLSLSCLYAIPFGGGGGPTSPLGVAPRIHWAVETGADAGRSVDLLHLCSPNASFVAPIPKKQATTADQPLLINDGIFALPLPVPVPITSGGEPLPTWASQGILIYASLMPFGVRVAQHAPAAATLARLQGRRA